MLVSAGSPHLIEYSPWPVAELLNLESHNALHYSPVYLYISGLLTMDIGPPWACPPCKTPWSLIKSYFWGHHKVNFLLLAIPDALDHCLPKGVASALLTPTRQQHVRWFISQRVNDSLQPDLPNITNSKSGSPTARYITFHWTLETLESFYSYYYCINVF